MIYLIVVNFTLFAVIFHQILYWHWFWQLKEYRLDRVRASFATKYDWLKAIKEQFDLRRWFRPKLTVRLAITGAISFLIESLSWLYLNLLYLTLGFTASQPLILQQIGGNIILVAVAPLTIPISLALTSPVFILAKKILVYVAKQKMNHFKGTVIGITGSYGKTSTKELLAFVLSQKHKVAKTERNDNSEIGVAKTVLRLKGDENFFVVEMGAYKIGEIKQICDTVKPKIGIITGLGDQHLALFGSLDNLRKAKYELVDSLPNNGFRLIAGVDFSSDRPDEFSRSASSFTGGGR